MRTTFSSLRKKFQRRAAAFAGLAGAALLAGGTPAWAATYYVAPGGNDSSAGTSLGTAWLTLSKVNSSLQPGDVVLIQPGTYSGGITPARDGGPSSRISYVGSPTSPGAAVVASITLSGRSYISVKGVTSSGDISIVARWTSDATSAPAEYDSVLYVTGLAGLTMNGAHFSHVRHCTIGNGTAGDEFSMTNLFQDSTRFCTIEDNVFTFTAAVESYATHFAGIRNCSFSRNRFNLRVLPASGAAGMVPRYTMLDCSFTDNKWIFKNDNDDAPTSSGLLLRDRCRFNSWTRDTFLVHPSSTYRIKYRFGSGGNDASTGNHYTDGLNYDDWRFHNDAKGSCGNNTWTDCYFQSDGERAEGIGMSQRTHSDRFFGNTFVTKSPVVFFADSLYFHHNTIINLGSPDVVSGESESVITGSTIRRNIFYGTGSNTSYPTVTLPYSNTVSSDSNAVYSLGGNPNDAFHERFHDWSCKAGEGCSWCDTYRKDCASRWFNPEFLDLTWSSPPNPRPGNAAAFLAWGADGYVGAIRPGTSVGDLTAPAAVGDLALALVSDHTVVLSWTATGDDGMTGQASAYDLRWSNQPITASNFAAATPVGIQPVPAVAGSTQSYVLTDLVLSTNYYFALRVVDESGNWSGLGNVLGAITKATDTVPPAPVMLGP
jgi:hypothetical protein